MIYPETQWWREVLLETEWPHVYEEIALTKTLTN
jgi:hypothetical protein